MKKITRSEIIERAKKEIPPDLYQDSGGYPTMEDYNYKKRQLLIRGIRIGLEMGGIQIDDTQ